MSEKVSNSIKDAEINFVSSLFLPFFPEDISIWIYWFIRDFV